MVSTFFSLTFQRLAFAGSVPHRAHAFPHYHNNDELGRRASCSTLLLFSPRAEAELRSERQSPLSSAEEAYGQDSADEEGYPPCHEPRLPKMANGWMAPADRQVNLD